MASKDAPMDDAALLQASIRGHAASLDTPEPFKIAPCLVGHDCPDSGCGTFGEIKCDSAGWVFCQNAVCDDEPVVDPKSGRLVAKCHCWQPSNTNLSFLPLTHNSGANCVMNAGPGGEDMCKAIANGALFSTYGPTGDFLPGKPLETANCPPQTKWAWCWGAPCERDDKGDIICSCPMMISTNSANQTLSLVPSECPSEAGADTNPCEGSIHNSMPAGLASSDVNPNGKKPCFSY